MILYGSFTSPFVRAARIAAIELRLSFEFAPTIVRPTQPNAAYGDGVNPLRRVPALETDDGAVIVDSRVIVEYLNDLAEGRIIPAHGAARIECLNRHAVAAGATEALVSAMYERRMRPKEKQWAGWADDQIDKARAALDWIEARCGAYSKEFDLGAIGLVCLLDYAAFRFPEIDWLAARPGIAALRREMDHRASVSDTMPSE
jgi:glutathione S-transferase